MKTRSPVVVLLLSLVTLGIYALVWHVKTKTEMNETYNAGIPTAWILLVPFVGGLYWMWKWSEGAEKATGLSGITVFLLMALLPVVGIPVMVSKFNATQSPIAHAQAIRIAA